MTQSLRDKLESEIGVVGYGDIQAHAKRGGLFLVSPETRLGDVAEALATDDKARIEAWIATGALRRPTAEELEAWTAEGASFLFDFSIVQPFVLARVRDDDAH